MPRRKRIKWTNYIPVTLAIVLGGIILEQYRQLEPEWHIIVPWALTVIFFGLWRFDRRPVKVDSESPKTKVKRYK